MRSTRFIELLVKSDIRVLKIYEDENNQNEMERFSWWAIHEFTPAVLSGEEPIFHHEVTGIEITDFINMNYSIDNPIEFIKRITDFIENRDKMICKFHNSMKYKLYVS